MYSTPQPRPMSSEKLPRRGADDVIFQHKVSEQSRKVTYRWTEQQSRIFWEHVQEFPDYYAENIDVLLKRLDLDGYEGIETKKGIKFKKEVLIPKVLSKLSDVVLDTEKYRKFKPNGDENASSDESPNLPAQVEDRHPPMSLSNFPQGRAEPGHTQHGAAKSGSTLGLENISQNLHNNRESATTTSPLEDIVNHLEDFIENLKNGNGSKGFAQQGYSRRYRSVSDDNTEFSDYDNY
ncbi:uncharacterized protein F4812DRAFT_470043 [Daldinia caldariorum]|uniref:uncharacterized protein n=1 Tax=Daldinia caldariorum TaxID=326644 RepID=UPI0020086617|nr:uncharacterized protein F4812DRAFT_470043 [Daldinia caldariorum]KAI1470069.1 hypothetical protein F4812DRAFT_470043 [Daldinia caldariorum]